MFFFFKAKPAVTRANEEDRRVFARMKAQVELRCIEQDSEQAGRTFDVSAQGLGVVSENKMKPASPVRIFLTFPATREEFSTAGKIIWCRRLKRKEFHCGVLLDKPELMIVSQLLNGLSKPSA